MTTEEFSSEGFDLDAISSKIEASKGDGIVYEIGGGVSVDQRRAALKEDSVVVEEKNAIGKAEELKKKGNEYFKAGSHLDAYDSYTEAMGACPGMKGSEILKMREKHDDKEREKSYRANRREVHTRKRIPPLGSENESNSSPKKDVEEENDDEENGDEKFVSCEFKVPHHEHGKHLAVYHSNRAACLLHLGRYEDSINDCDIAILVNPTYSKAFIRRMTAYEKTDRSEEALKDAKTAQDIDPKNRDIRNHVLRLQKIEDERIEKLKVETMDKLKDLGNSILGNFGMSLDNFKTDKDPKTGSYNISFQN